MRLVEIPDDGIVSEYILAGDSVVSIRRIDLSYLPTIEAEPVRHGRWERKRHKLFGNSYDYVCSACGCDYALAEYNYCPHCGAKMDGGINDGTDYER